jgi:prevent-host-death family protein
MNTSHPAVWQLQEAKNKFSQVVDAAASGQDQIITRHGKQVAKVCAHTDDKDKFAGKSLVELFAPFRGLHFPELDNVRDRTPYDKPSPFEEIL